MTAQEQFQVFLPVVVAAILGGLVGLEREIAGKPAGMRTHMLVSASAGLMIVLGKALSLQFGRLAHRDISAEADPGRLIQAIVVGISFIGAGTILHSSDHQRVRYLTTAASILFTSGVGIASGAELYILAALSTLLAVLVNWGFGGWEEKALHGKALASDRSD